MEDYLDKFQFLISEADYTDLNIIVVKFYYRLKSAIQNQIAILLVERLDNTDIST